MLQPPYSNYGSIKIPNPPGAAIRNTYQIAQFPTVILITPNGNIVEQDIWPISNAILRNRVALHGGVVSSCEAPQTFDLNLTVNPAEGGSVTGGGEYEAGASVEISATPNDFWQFVNWTNEDGGVVSTDAQHTFVMPEADTELTANFEEIPTFTLTLVSNPEGGGVLTGQGEYFAGEMVEISATDNPEFAFLSWTDEQQNIISEDSTHTIEIPEKDLTITANFKVTTSVLELTDKLSPVVFPNPTSDLLTIVLPENLAGGAFRIYDLAGKLWQKGTAQQQQTNLSLQGLPTGLYLLVFENQDIAPVRIVKE